MSWLLATHVTCGTGDCASLISVMTSILCTGLGRGVAGVHAAQKPLASILNHSTSGLKCCWSHDDPGNTFLFANTLQSSYISCK